MTRYDRSGGVTITRRRLLGASGAALLPATAGCSPLANFIGGRVLEQINVFDQTDRRIEGPVEVLGPTGDTALDDTFDVISSTPDGKEEGSNIATYGDVWSETGSYEVSIRLDDAEADGVARATETVAIEDTDEEMLGIALAGRTHRRPRGRESHRRGRGVIRDGRAATAS